MIMITYEIKSYKFLLCVFIVTWILFCDVHIFTTQSMWHGLQLSEPV